jgi:hypothetical protein
VAGERQIAALEGEWRLRREGGLLPPLGGVRKRIAGGRGTTHVGPLPGVPFRVESRPAGGAALVYVSPLSAFVDVLEPRPDGGWWGSARLAGREYGRFVMERAPAPAPGPRA